MICIRTQKLWKVTDVLLSLGDFVLYGGWLGELLQFGGHCSVNGELLRELFVNDTTLNASASTYQCQRTLVCNQRYLGSSLWSESLL